MGFRKSSSIIVTRAPANGLFSMPRAVAMPVIWSAVRVGRVSSERSFRSIPISRIWSYNVTCGFPGGTRNGRATVTSPGGTRKLLTGPAMSSRGVRA